MLPIFAIFCTFVIPGYIVFFIISRRHTERMEMIKRGVYPVEMNYFGGGRTLLWGLLLTAVGIALLLVYFIQDKGSLTPSMICLFGGVAILLYWKLTARDREEARKVRADYLMKAAGEKVQPKTKSMNREEVAEEKTL